MANVEDFKCTEYPEDLLNAIFEHQHNLAVKYIPIEQSNGLCLYDQIPADIDNAKAQARIKDMSWRAVEEVAEAYEAYENGEDTHFLEELADALHFLIEKYLLCGFRPKRTLEEYFDSLDAQLARDEEKHNPTIAYVGEFCVACGLTCNCLKNKPWKQSQILTDKAKFERLLEAEFGQFIILCSRAGFSDAKSLYNMYNRKNQVNQFRQRSNY
jgi:dimeric dUTPase (all-alpha-NTP-PPase superfamily)